MKLLREIRDSDVFTNSQDQDPSSFAETATSRIVLLNSLGHIALLKVGKFNYHKLPGGGIETGENPEQALERELLEEMGRRARIISEVGMIIEYKNDQQRKQTSYCYLGELTDAIVPTNRTETELAHDYSEVWVNDITAAISQVEADEPIGYSREFIRVRELEFLRTAKLLLQ